MSTTKWEPDDLESEILGELAGERALRVESLCEALDADPDAVDRACFRLETDGAIRPRSDGAYVRID